MQAPCSHCGTLHALNDAQTTGHPRVQFRCTRCGKNTIVKTQGADSTQVLSPPPDISRSSGAAGSGPGDAAPSGPDARGFFLPANKVISLSIISGPARGQALSLEKPAVVLGRADADFIINDANISRHHCTVEVRGESVHLRDLDSTNGTFIGIERVRTADLRHLSEFRVGLSVILLTITPKLSSAL